MLILQSHAESFIRDCPGKKKPFCYLSRVLQIMGGFCISEFKNYVEKSLRRILSFLSLLSPLNYLRGPSCSRLAGHTTTDMTNIIVTPPMFM